MAVDEVPHRIIADLLASYTGQTLAESRRWRVSTALSGLFREYGISNVEQLVCLLAEPGQKKLETQVVEALLNNETYFFRDIAFFDLLEKEVLPELARQREGSKRLSIWSAGCSTGQEALSLAMIFAKRPDRWDGWTIEIVGTDVSGKAIEQARKGHYSQFEIQRGITVSAMLEFFTETEKGWLASDRLCKMTRFEQQNLLDRQTIVGSFDLVLCRNVLLYFDPNTRRRAFARIADATAPDGWLMLGAGETAAGQTDSFAGSDVGGPFWRKTASVPDFAAPSRWAANSNF